MFASSDLARRAGDRHDYWKAVSTNQQFADMHLPPADQAYVFAKEILASNAVGAFSYVVVFDSVCGVGGGFECIH